MSQKEPAVEGPSTSTRVQPKRGQSSQSQGQDLKQMISDALAPIRKNLAKLPTKQTIDTLLNDLVDRLERKLRKISRKEPLQLSQGLISSSKGLTRWKVPWLL